MAKNIAALETLKMLIPGFEPDDKFMLTGRAEQDLGYFDHLAVRLFSPHFLRLNFFRQFFYGKVQGGVYLDDSSFFRPKWTAIF